MKNNPWNLSETTISKLSLNTSKYQFIAYYTRAARVFDIPGNNQALLAECDRNGETADHYCYLLIRGSKLNAAKVNHHFLNTCTKEEFLLFIKETIDADSTLLSTN